MDINELLRVALQREASDLHLVVPNPPVLRIDGRLHLLEEYPRVTPQLTESIFQSITTKNQQLTFEQEQELDFSYEIPETSRVRVNVSLQRDSISIVFRLIPLNIPTCEELGLPEICKAISLLPRGLVLVTGPTGSGKSSTLAAMLNYLNQVEEKKIVTIEDPIEFIFPTGKCVVSQRQLGSDTRSFGSAVGHVLRQDPNVIMIGEIRDLETMTNALTAAETGHLVLSTLHTRGAAQSVSRIIDVFPGPQQPLIRTQLANVIEAVISQALLRRADGHGRVAAFEVMVGNNAIRNLIREDKLNQIPIFMEAGRDEGMKLLTQDLERLVLSGVITQEEALTVTPGIKQAEAKAKRATANGLVAKIKASKAVREPAPEPAPETAPEPVPDAITQFLALSNKKPAEAAKPEPKAQPPAPEVPEETPSLEMTADQLISNYLDDGPGADAKFLNKVIRLSGEIERIEVEYTLGIYYIILADGHTNQARRIRCIFDKKNAAELNSLKRGQPVVVQGKLTGSRGDLRMRECALIR